MTPATPPTPPPLDLAAAIVEKKWEAAYLLFDRANEGQEINLPAAWKNAPQSFRDGWMRSVETVCATVGRAPAAHSPTVEWERCKAHIGFDERDEAKEADAFGYFLRGWYARAGEAAFQDGDRTRECWGLYNEHGIVMWQEHKPFHPHDLKPGFKWVHMVEAPSAAAPGMDGEGGGEWILRWDFGNVKVIGPLVGRKVDIRVREVRADVDTRGGEVTG